jgi:ParB/RepB/Spo0J family partition protein
MENFMEQVDVKDLVYESNRKYGKDAGFEQLKESIREYGILEPILVRPMEDGRYRVIAGRRRAQAAAEAGLKAVDCIVRSDGADDGELALVENINRLEMHPLDEADIFRRMKDAGATVEYIAAYFARSRAAISQRIRLSGLSEGGRELFREEKLDIKGAVLLAGLPEEDQEAFYKKRGGKESTVWEVQDYIVRTQDCRLYPIMEDGFCADCRERTRNGDAGLFEDDHGFADVCLNPDCYKEVWRRLIKAALRETREGHPGGGEITRISFGVNIPKQIYGQESVVEFDGQRYEVLNPHRYILCTEETNRKKNVYWNISHRNGIIAVTRCGYETREAHKKSETQRMTRNLVEEYGKELLTTLGAEGQTKPEAIAGMLKARGIDRYDLSACIRDRIRRRVRERNLSQKENRNYAAMFLRASGTSEEGLEQYTGFKSFEDIPVESEAQVFFHFLISRLEPYNFVPPNLGDLADAGQVYREKLFWKYAGMDEERYRALYLEEGRKVVEHLARGGTAETLKDEDMTGEPEEEA